MNRHRNQILLVMPTRGRPMQAIDALQSVITNCTTHQVLFRVGQDEDDEQAFHLVLRSDPRLIEYYYRPRIPFGPWLNELAIPGLAFTKYIGWLADDDRYTQKGWDAALLEHDEMVVYGPDGWHNEKLVTHPFVHAEMYTALKHLCPDGLKHLCIDTYLGEIAREMGSLSYEPRIAMEHLHYTFGKAPEDQNYRESKRHWDKDVDHWEKELKPTIPLLAKQVRRHVMAHSPLTIVEPEA